MKYGSLIKIFIYKNKYSKKLKKDIDYKDISSMKLYEAFDYCRELINDFLHCTYTENVYSKIFQSLLIQQVKILTSILYIIKSLNTTGQEILSRSIADIYIKIKWMIYSRNNKKDLNTFISMNGDVSPNYLSKKVLNRPKDYDLYQYLCSEPHSNLMTIESKNISEGFSNLDDVKDFWRPSLLCVLIVMLSNISFSIYESGIVKSTTSLQYLVRLMNRRIHYFGGKSYDLKKELDKN